MEQIRAEKLVLGYGSKEVVRNVNFTINKGEFLSIIGPSGVGKSTLLMGVNATTSILSGQLQVLGKDLNAIGHRELKVLRSRIGVIFQGFNLVSRLSVLDNIASGMLHRKPLFAALIKHYSKQQYEEIYEYMKVVGIEAEALSRCDRLSGGQKQRVAIARAIAQHPEIILADEPISSLDPVSARTVLDTLRNANEKYGMTIIANLHQIDYAREYCNRVIGMNAGRIVYDGSPADLCQATIDQIYCCSPKKQEEKRQYHYPFSPAAASAE
ncbi:MAG TPA: phosphonate ABC transporter ATP-binding protein [Desulfuromonadales bacterium]|nr:phosphonate ABC transporter ATP-binding protein [Desulfuromonadales bacterium]